MSSSTSFHVFNEFSFLDHMEKESYFVIENGEYMETEMDLTGFQSHFRYIAWMLESRRDHGVEDTNPFFRASFKWVIATEGSVKNITGISLLRIPDKIDAVGDIVYLEVEHPNNPPALTELHDEARKVAGTWYEGMLPHYDITLWKEMLNVQFMHLLNQGTIK